MKRIKEPNDVWRTKLDSETYKITREQGTELPFSGKYWNHFETGEYSCVCCGAQLFASDTKFDAGCGWPSFYDLIDKETIRLVKDTSHGMIRTEVRCNNCDAHLGHVFEDGPQPTGLRYCINSVSLVFQPDE